ncbi:hypothetical protein PRZ48_005924 [Zasmidium cellare]|uniref:Uncharacterized protein n=1 Tax=Zasmidium cellare TaxID=395010 RepID=A0ABR0EMA4_ZASCE|nr:hypothetical protein PRZ48_005924 [Zasmidium cellare]
MKQFSNILGVALAAITIASAGVIKDRAAPDQDLVSSVSSVSTAFTTLSAWPTSTASSIAELSNTNEISSLNNTIANPDLHDREVRSVVFWQAPSDDCHGDGRQTVINGGAKGGPEVTGCFPLDKDSTHYSVDQVIGCKTTMVTGTCGVSINFDTWLPTGICTSFDVKGRTDVRLYYRCDE